MNHVERLVLLAGSRWIPLHEEKDYDGTDAIMRPHDPVTGIAEAGQVEFQLKATDSIRLVENKQFAACRAEVSHLNFWACEAFFPVVLVQYDAARNLAYFVDIRDWVTNNDELNDHIEKGHATATLKIPIRNVLTPEVIDGFRLQVRDMMPKD